MKHANVCRSSLVAVGSIPDLRISPKEESIQGVGATPDEDEKATWDTAYSDFRRKKEEVG
jgi:hypothetical protein